MLGIPFEIKKHMHISSDNQASQSLDLGLQSLHSREKTNLLFIA